MASHVLFIALSEGEIIDLDGTLLIQLAIFFLALIVLRAFVFKPLISLFEAREAAMEGARAEARRLEQEAKQKGATFDEEMRQVRAAAQEERDRLRAEGLKTERDLLDQARREAQLLLADAEKKLAAERSKIQIEMRSKSPEIGRQIASKLLGREVA